MASNMYLEHYLDSIENLPFELQRNFTLMRELDQRTQDLSKEINTMSEDYMANVRSMDAPNRTSHLKKIENAFVKSREYGDDKVQLAMQTYEMVCNYNHYRYSRHSLASIIARVRNSRV
ncbi:Inhibitor of growth protein 4 [Desmophyllum pertusum]|uniref:Inhibitor of growth protein 4 n=1 Tax=Desmophyllum pertusum TaxID=174260 RepID=A0A9W9ZFL4_9CNID|nr:Inhibitor of growth protein 4 [Desmophyllum pertusum]